LRFLRFFLADKVKHKSLWMIHGACWLVPLALSIGTLIQACVASNGSEAINVFPGTYFCVPLPSADPSFYIFYIPTSVLIGILFVTLISSFIKMILRNHHILYFQWRTFIFGIQCLIFYIFVQIIFYYYADSVWDFSGPLIEYASCVASHPSDPSPPCSRQYLVGFWYYSLFCAQLYGWMIIFTLYVYWSNPLMWKWWYLFITTQQIPDMERVISSYSTTA
jgi:hypothetical protein